MARIIKMLLTTTIFALIIGKAAAVQVEHLSGKYSNDNLSQVKEKIPEKRITERVPTEKTTTTTSSPVTTTATAAPDQIKTTSTTAGTPDLNTTTTESPEGIVVPDITGNATDGSICLKANLDLNITTKYKTEDQTDALATFQLPKEAADTEVACAGATLSGGEMGPAVAYNWTWDSQRAKEASYGNRVVVLFETDGKISSLKSIKADVNTTIFANSLGERASYTATFQNIRTSAGASFTCRSGSGKLSSSDPEGQSISINKIGFEIGQNLGTGNTFTPGLTCGASGVYFTLITLFAAVLASQFSLIV